MEEPACCNAIARKLMRKITPPPDLENENRIAGRKTFQPRYDLMKRRCTTMINILFHGYPVFFVPDNHNPFPETGDLKIREPLLEFSGNKYIIAHISRQ